MPAIGLGDRDDSNPLVLNTVAAAVFHYDDTVDVRNQGIDVKQRKYNETFVGNHFVCGRPTLHCVGNRRLGGFVVELINLLVVLGFPVDEDAADDDEVFGFVLKNPDLVLVDTQVIALSPPRLLVAGMGDALATWFEAKTCVKGHVKNMRGGLSTQSALALAKLCYGTLLADGADALRAVQSQVVTPALERLVEANTLLSGIGFESSGLAAAHAIHNGLTTAKATHAYPHGEKVAFGLLAQLVLEGQPRSVLHRVLSFATEVGLPITLADIGLTELPKEQLQKIAVRATAENETIHNEPFEVLPDMVADVIVAADAMGRSWKKGHSMQ